jgi:hypothetical protein
MILMPRASGRVRLYPARRDHAFLAVDRSHSCPCNANDVFVHAQVLLWSMELAFRPKSPFPDLNLTSHNSYAGLA